MKPLSLPKAGTAMQALENAMFQQAGGNVDDAREAAALAVHDILDALGLSERALEVVRQIIVATETEGASEFDLAVVRGDVRDELAGRVDVR